MMEVADSLVDLIGDTPLIRLHSVTAGIGCTVLAKVESFNPGGSAKDRIALAMVRAAEADGRLAAGGTIVEPTSGNTGVALAMVAQLSGYRCVFTCPDKVSADKIALLRAYGAEVVSCPAAVPPSDPRSYRSVATRLAAEIPGGVCLDQYSNEQNPESHYRTTGPELWRQTDGTISHFVAGIGTGGTISGTGRYLREISGSRVQVIGADPHGSIYSGGPLRPYLVEGVGQHAWPGNYDRAVADEIIAVSDADAIRMTRRLAREEGLLTGGSGGMAVVAALQVAARLDRDAVLVVLLPDSGRGYLSKIYDDGWLARMGLLDQAPPGEQVRDLLDLGFDGGSSPVLDPDLPVTEAMRALVAEEAPYLLVGRTKLPARLAEISGLVGGLELAAMLATNQITSDQPIQSAALAVPQLGAGQSIRTALELLAGQPAAAVVLDGSLVQGVLTVPSLLTALSRRHRPADPQNHHTTTRGTP